MFYLTLTSDTSLIVVLVRLNVSYRYLRSSLSIEIRVCFIRSLVFYFLKRVEVKYYDYLKQLFW